MVVGSTPVFLLLTITSFYLVCYRDSLIYDILLLLVILHNYLVIHEILVHRSLNFGLEVDVSSLHISFLLMFA
jgi:hypothetical protein